MTNLIIRGIPKPTDQTRMTEIMQSTKFFRDDENCIPCAMLLKTIDKSAEYEFIFADVDGVLAGFACFGKEDGTIGTHKLHWLVIHSDFQRLGIGKKLLSIVEEKTKASKAHQLLIPTSGMHLYKNTRNFYEQEGYIKVAEIKDYFAQRDDLWMYKKEF